MHPLIDAITWTLFATLMIGSYVAGFYLLMSSSDHLTVRYQNHMLRKTGLPLKDEDFSTMPRVLLLFRTAGVLFIAFGSLLTLWVYTLTFIAK